MATTDMLGKALTMAADARAGGIGRGRTLGDALLRTMGSAGDCHAILTIPVYPRDVQRRDLEGIGRDMYRAFGKDAEAQVPPQG